MYPECDFQVKVIFSCDGGIIVSTSNEHNHVHRASTTRAPSPVRKIVIDSVAAGLSCIQTRRAIEHQFKGVVSRSQLYSLLSYHRVLTLPDINFVDDFRSWRHQHSALAADSTAIYDQTKQDQL